MPSQTSIANLRCFTAVNPHDPIEQILSAHGVPPRTRQAAAQGCRDRKTIDAIISDIQALNANGGVLN